jgi:hypothetical protein
MVSPAGRPDRAVDVAASAAVMLLAVGQPPA